MPAPFLIPAPSEDLCLAFANTRFWRGSDPTETLHDQAELTVWLAASAGVPKAALAAVNDTGMFAPAIVLREAIYRIFSAAGAAEPIPADDLDLLNTSLAAAPSRDRLARDGNIYAWAIDETVPSVPFLLAPVLWSAGDLLTQAGHRSIRRCANEKCLWVFMDRSKGGTRRWCDMNACGNRAKSHRHYLKSKRA